MSIEQIQEAFRRAGYQWQENVYCDGLPECSIKFTKEPSPHYFTDHPCGDFGWGRFNRLHCWLMAWEWLQKNGA